MPLQLKRLTDFDAYRVNFKGFGISGSAAAGTTTDIDYKLTDARLIYGGYAVLKDHAFGDYITMQVVDVDNILGYGAGTVLGEYIKDWYVAADAQSQTPILVDYPTEVATNLYFRIKYTSFGGSSVSVRINIFCVKNITE